MNLHHKYTLCILTLLCHYCVIIAKAELNQRKLLEAKIANDVAEMERRKALAGATVAEEQEIAERLEEASSSVEKEHPRLEQEKDQKIQVSGKLHT